MEEDKTTLEILQKRFNRAYLEDWQDDAQDPARILQDIGRKLLEDSAQRMSRMMDYHRVQFLSTHLVEPRRSAPLQTLLQFHLSNAFSSAFLPRHTPLYLQSEELVAIQTKEDICLQHTRLQSVIAFQPTTGALIKEDPEQPLSLFGFQGSDRQEFMLSFTLPDVFAQMKHPLFHLYVKGVDEDETKGLLRLFCHAHVHWQCNFQGETAGPLQLTMEEDHLLVRLPFTFSAAGGEVQVSLRYEDHQNLPSFYLQELQLQLPSQRFPFTSVIVNEVPEKTEHFRLFDAPLSLFQMCYLRCDEVFPRRGAYLDWEFDLMEQSILQGEELLDKEEYRMFMRRLPRNPIIYEVYCEQVQLEYFNGEWVRISEAVLRKEDFTQTPQKHHLRFLCPMDIQPYSYDGETAYWFRFVLIKAENCYQLPSRHHLPILRHSRVSYSFAETKVAARNLQVLANLERRSLIPNTNNCLPLWEERQETQDTLFLCLHTQLGQSPLRVYVEMRQQLDVHYDLCFELLQDRIHAIALDVEDTTEGFAHSGMLSLFLPEVLPQVTLFDTTGCWIRIRKQDQEPFYNVLVKLHWNCVGASACVYATSQIEVSMEEEYGVLLRDEEIVKVEVQEGERWVEWQLCETIDGLRKIAQTTKGLRFERRWFPHEVQLQTALSLQLTLRQPQKVNTYPKGSNVLPAKANPRILSIHTMNQSVQYAQVETAETRLAHSAYALSHGSAFATRKEMEQQLLFAFLDLYDVHCELVHDQCATLHVYTLWKCQDHDVYAHNEELRLYMEERYPFALYHRKLQVGSSQIAYCEVTLCLQDTDMDQDHELEEVLRVYLDPLQGQDGKGWKIGEFPEEKEVLHFLKECFPTTPFYSCTLRAQLLYGLYKALKPFAEVTHGYHIAFGTLRILRKETTS